MIKTSPKQLQAVLFSILNSNKKNLYTGEIYETYRKFCENTDIYFLSQRAVSDIILELDMYGFIIARTVSKGRYGRTKEISVVLSDKTIKEIVNAIVVNLY